MEVMMKFGSVDEILDFAIQREEEAHDFYKNLSGQMKNPQMKKVFEEFANEEKAHKVKLQKIKVDKTLIPAKKNIQSLDIGDYLVDVEVTEDLDYQDALNLAMKKEKAAFKLYLDLASSTDDSGLQSLFSALAQEEAKHKLRFELEYDEFIYSEN
jgi:rubrerythrin